MFRHDDDTLQIGASVELLVLLNGTGNQRSCAEQRSKMTTQVVIALEKMLTQSKKTVC